MGSLERGSRRLRVERTRPWAVVSRLMCSLITEGKDSMGVDDGTDNDSVGNGGKAEMRIDVKAIGTI